MKKEKAITLIALVITIIILLILAGISIASLTGSGLFGKAKEAKQESENAQILENQILEDYENKIMNYINSESNTEGDTEEQYYIITYMNGEDSFQKKLIKGEKCDLGDIEKEGYIF